MGRIGRVFDLYVRRFLPPKQVTVNGVSVYGGTVLDRSLGDMTGYETELIAELEAAIRPDDHVCIVGGGLGVTTVLAARTASQVTTYEAGRVNARNIARTIQAHGLEHATVIPKPVGNPIAIWGRDPNPSDAVPPATLPACDVLELDCEGSELEILATLEIRPRTIVVESHGMHGAPSSDVEAALDTLGYDIQSRTPEDQANDVIIIRATRPPPTNH